MVVVFLSARDITFHLADAFIQSFYHHVTFIHRRHNYREQLRVKRLAQGHVDYCRRV